MADASQPQPQEDRELSIALYTQMFALSGAMVGVCLTVIGVLRLMTEVKGYRTLGDDLVAVDGIFFLFACVFSFLTLKALDAEKRKTFRRITDTLFLVAITLMLVICVLITWAFTHIQGGGS